MNESDDRIVGLLTEMRDNQREALALQKAAVARYRRQLWVYYIALAILLLAGLYFLILL